jgi:hypothetical protein
VKHLKIYEEFKRFSDRGFDFIEIDLEKDIYKGAPNPHFRNKHNEYVLNKLRDILLNKFISFTSRKINKDFF